MPAERIKTDNIIAELQKFFPGIHECIADGEVHRFGKQKKLWYTAQYQQSKEGYLVLYCTVGDWSTGEKYQFYQSDRSGPRMGSTFRLKRRVPPNSMDVARHHLVAKACNAEYESLSMDGKSPYLLEKGISTFMDPGIRYGDGFFAIPCAEPTGKLWGLQKVHDNGKKYFTPGQRIDGLCHLIGPAITKRCLITEGYATAVSLHLATGLPVASCFHAGNLPKAARVLYEHYPGVQWLICGDDDHATKDNVGVAKCVETAFMLDAAFVLPRFMTLNGKETTDFNDLHRLEGLDVVRTQLEEYL